MKFETWDLRLLRIFFSAFAILADEMKVVFFGVCLRNTQARTVLPYITLLTSHAVRPVVLVNVRINILNFQRAWKYHLRD